MHKSHDNTFLSWADLRAIYSKYLAMIWLGAFTLAFGVVALLLSMPKQYEAKATFKDAGMNQNRQQIGLIKQLIGISGEKDSKAQVLFYSDALLVPLIQKLGMQLQPNPDIVFHDVIFDGASVVQGEITRLDSHTALFAPINLQMPFTGQWQEDFKVKLYPLHKTLARVKKRLKIKVSEKDPNVLYLSFTSENPQLAKKFLNELMLSYQAYLKKENEQISKEQVLFLKKRKQSLLQDLNLNLEDHAKYLEDNIGDLGFFTFSQILEQMSEKQKELDAQQLQCDLELNSLFAFQDNEIDSTSLIGSLDYSQLQEYEKHKLQLQKKQKRLKVSVIDEALQTREYKLKQLEKELVTQVFFPKPNPPFSLIRKQHHLQQSPKEVQRNAFSGIDSELATTLLVEYNKQLDTIHQQMHQYQYIQRAAIKDVYSIPSFSKKFRNPIAEALITDIANILQQIQQEGWISIKEKQLLTTSLKHKTTRLNKQITHMLQLLKIESNLMESTIKELKAQLLSLATEDISLLQTQMDKQTEAKIAAIKKQKKLIQKQIAEIKMQMQNIPEKWLRENKLAMQSKLDVNILRGVLETLESKNIEYLMMQVLAKPIDIATTPIHAKPRYLPAVFLIAFLIGMGAMMTIAIMQSLRKGVPCTKHNLPFLGITSYSHLSRLKDSFEELSIAEKNNLRFISQDLAQFNAFFLKSHDVLIAHLGLLLSKQKKKTLVVWLEGNTDKKTVMESLEKKQAIKIDKTNEYDQVYFGSGPFSYEYLQRKEFVEWMGALTYDHVLFVSGLTLESPEGKWLQEHTQKWFVPKHKQTKEFYLSFPTDKLAIVY